MQIQAKDGSGQVSQPLEPRFQEAADAVAMFDGSAGTDAYLDAWGFGPPFQVDGTAAEAASKLAASFNTGMPGDFVARIRDLHRAGKRNAVAGAIDGWAGVDTPAAT